MKDADNPTDELLRQLRGRVNSLASQVEGISIRINSVDETHYLAKQRLKEVTDTLSHIKSERDHMKTVQHRTGRALLAVETKVAELNARLNTPWYKRIFL